MNPMPDGQSYLEHHTVAEAWARRAEWDLRAEWWLPTDLERRIAGDLRRVTGDPWTRRPPHIDEPLWRRLRRVARWAPAIRLSMLAGGWSLPPSIAVSTTVIEPVSTPAADTRATLPSLLTGLYGPLTLVEKWCAIHVHAGSSGNAHADAELTRQVPGCLDHVAAAELFLYDVAPMLLAIESGDISS